MHDEAAVRLVPQGCLGAGMAHWSGPSQRHRCQSGLQFVGGGWRCGGAHHHSEVASSAEDTPWRRLSSRGEREPQAWRWFWALLLSTQATLVAVQRLSELCGRRVACGVGRMLWKSRFKMMEPKVSGSQGCGGGKWKGEVHGSGCPLRAGAAPHCLETSVVVRTGRGCVSVCVTGI